MTLDKANLGPFTDVTAFAIDFKAIVIGFRDCPPCHLDVVIADNRGSE